MAQAATQFADQRDPRIDAAISRLNEARNSANEAARLLAECHSTRGSARKAAAFAQGLSLLGKALWSI